jgi:hypothetical protein
MFVLCSKALMTGRSAETTLLGEFAARWQAEQVIKTLRLRLSQ